MPKFWCRSECRVFFHWSIQQYDRKYQKWQKLIQKWKMWYFLIRVRGFQNGLCFPWVWLHGGSAGKKKMLLLQPVELANHHWDDTGLAWNGQTHSFSRVDAHAEAEINSTAVHMEPFSTLCLPVLQDHDNERLLNTITASPTTTPHPNFIVLFWRHRKCSTGQCARPKFTRTLTQNHYRHDTTKGHTRNSKLNIKISQIIESIFQICASELKLSGQV